ncbi:hypothetical protein DFH07DRAFT_775932 [Mycena maculata]|uniref:Uncharacterized protein n=1 Tax=Mycena maculata TaxID=230809 RepID=A0AAD7ISV8_9AGAR|nr:hypothetical protein DFH07DRAFT_775932 [Mycena maculata]
MQNHWSAHPRGLQYSSLSNLKAVGVYNPNNLLLCTHGEIISQGKEVEAAMTTAQAKHFAKKYGVKGVPLLSFLHSLSFPSSFAYDFMHLIWENLIENLTLLWTSDFKGLDEGTKQYELAMAVWEAITSQTESAADMIPSTYGSRILNIAKDRPTVSVEMWSSWTLYLGPVLLRHHFRCVRYYRHFIQLVHLLNLCLQFEITDEEIEALCTGFIDWVQQYEIIYFQNDVEQMTLGAKANSYKGGTKDRQRMDKGQVQIPSTQSTSRAHFRTHSCLIRSPRDKNLIPAITIAGFLWLLATKFSDWRVLYFVAVFYSKIPVTPDDRIISSLKLCPRPVLTRIENETQQRMAGSPGHYWQSRQASHSFTSENSTPPAQANISAQLPLLPEISLGLGDLQAHFWWGKYQRGCREPLVVPDYKSPISMPNCAAASSYHVYQTPYWYQGILTEFRLQKRQAIYIHMRLESKALTLNYREAHFNHAKVNKEFTDVIYSKSQMTSRK